MWHFTSDNSQRKSEQWVEAIDWLVSKNWVRARGHGGYVFEVTVTGHQKANWLKAGMNIDINVDPLTEILEFE